MELASPGLPVFEYIRASSPQEVSSLLLEHAGQARVFMGGTDVFVQMRDHALTPETLIDVKHLPGISDISFDTQEGLKMGAAVDMNAMSRHPAVMEHYPLLVESADTVASYQLRTRATMGGNLCNASPAADTAPAALVLEAELIVQGPNGERAIPVSDFFLGVRKTALEPGEFLIRIEFPSQPPGAVSRYIKLGRNAAGDLSIVGVAVIGYPDSTTSSGYAFRIALASVAPTPIRCPKAESVLADGPLTNGTFESAALAAQAAASPIDDVRGSAVYRRAMVKNLTHRALVDVWDRLQEEA